MEHGLTKIIPPSYQGRPWTAKLIKSMTAAEIRRLISLYGLTQINAQVVMNAQRGVKG